MRALLFVLASLTSVAATDEMRRFEYPQDGFSIAAPAGWNEIEPAVLATLPAIMHQVIPNTPMMRPSHAFRSSTATAMPWAAIFLTDGPSVEMMFDKPEFTRRSVEELIKTWSADRAQSSHASYDGTRHLVWGLGQGSYAGFGEFWIFSGTYLTKAGAVQVNCYSKLADFEKDQSACRQIIDSVVIDPKIARAAGAAKRAVLAELTNADYQRLVKQVEGGDLSVDFRALRLACMKSPMCAPRSTPDELVALRRALDAGKIAEGAEIGERLIRQGFVNAEVHADLAKTYELLHNPEKSKFHQNVVTGLLFSILLSGDGITKETALEVICDREEYSVLVAKQLSYMGPGVSRTSLTEGGHTYEKWEVPDTKSTGTIVVFFNLDAFSAKSRPRSK